MHRCLGGRAEQTTSGLQEEGTGKKEGRPYFREGEKRLRQALLLVGKCSQSSSARAREHVSMRVSLCWVGCWAQAAGKKGQGPAAGVMNFAWPAGGLD